ncbi:glycerophosphodiester phosphodiesterase family protein [Gammaproteobacteria bacterium]|nr:glycerophosphodiester phosphodiesterase family protein [Gammaproteobacteria bacterium]
MVKIIGHRGASDDAPENTISSIKEAFMQGADGVEVDVRLTKDERVVCIHDKNTIRTTGLSLEVKNTNYGELKNLDAGSWKGAAWKDELIPSLEEVLKEVPINKEIFIEIKTSLEIIDPLISLVLSSKIMQKNITMISFNAEVIKEIKLRLPEVTCNLLTAFDPSYNEKDLPQLLKKIDADGVGVQNHAKLTKDFIEKIKNINKDVHVWTVNEGEKAKKYSLLGLSSITTNKPRHIKYFLSAS